MFDELYNSDRIKGVFGDAWCGPEVLPRHQEVRIAKYEENADDDGQGVEVYCTAMPAQFFTVKALAGKNSVGDENPGFILSTGSDCAEWAAETARMINTGMVGLGS